VARKNEKECLEVLKNAILGKSNMSIYANCDLKALSQYIFAAESNINSNMFPDFVFDGGGIEHFELTSSKETRKGSEFKIEENSNKKSREDFYKRTQEEFVSSEHIPGTVSTSNYEEIYESFTYEDFLKSLEKNVTNHVASLEKLQYQEKIVVFLMEQQTARLWLDEGIIPIRFYELHQDKIALEKIKQSCRNVDYLVYFVCDSIEIIDLHKIDDLISKARVFKNVKGGRLIKHEIMLCLDL
jgi:hypothetical protein